MSERLEQKIVHLPRGTSSPHHVEAKLNEVGQDGWRLQTITNVVDRGDGGAYVRRAGYWSEGFFLVVRRTEGGPEYRCRTLQCGRDPKTDGQALNELVAEQNQEGFALVHLDTVWGIAEDPDDPTRGSHAFVVVFEREQIGEDGALPVRVAASDLDPEPERR